MLNDDGTITPSYINWFLEPSGQNSTFSDTSMKVGRVIAVYYPSDSKNVNKTFTEYDVEAVYTEGSSPPIKTVFARCLVSSLFGGIADYIRWTPRKDDSTEGPILGSLVFIVCQNGNQRKAFIVGGIPHPESTVKDLEEHSFLFDFNGINFKINKDGECILKRRGVTNSKGEVEDTSGSDSFFMFTKTGDITLGYLENLNSDYVSLQLLKADKVLKAFSKNNTEFKTEDKFIVRTSNGIKVNPENVDQQAWIRGTVFRQKQTELHNTLKSLLQSLSGLIQTAATSLTVAGSTTSVAAGLNAIPIVGGALAAAPLGAAGAAHTAAGTALASSVAILTQMAIAIDSFESQTESYLSKYHLFGETP